MPIYEFKCDKCGHEFQKLCRMDETGENLACPGCGQKYPRKLISGFAVRGLSTPGLGGDKAASSGGGSACGGCTASSCAGCR